jgi:DNA-binding PadR family transcriptional regulator
MNITKRETILPLTPQTLQILVALSYGRATGYDLRRQVSEDTNGEMKITSGTVYPSLSRLAKMGLIMECESYGALRPGQEAHVHELTSAGRQVLGWELERIETAAQLGRERLASR